MKDFKGSLGSTIAMVLAVFVIAAAAVWAEDIDVAIQELLDAGDTTQAISILERQIESDPTYHINYYTLGMIYFNQEQWQQAIEQFELALDKKSKHWESLYHLGLCQLELGDLEGAEESMSRGLKKAKNEKHWFENGMGLIQMANEEFDEASKSFLKALVIDDQNAEYHINLGDAYYRQGVPSLACSEYEKAQALDTAGTDVYFHWAEACLEMRDYTGAMEKLRIVLTRDSTYVPAWRGAGEIYFKVAMSARTRQEREARFRDVIGSYRRYIGLSGISPDSSSVRAFYELGLAYVNVNGFEDASDVFDQVLAIPYEPRDIYFYYGKSLALTRSYEKGAEMLLRHIDWVAEQDSEYNGRISDAELYRLIGDCYYYRDPNDFANAVKYYKLSLEDNPEQERVVQNIAIGYHNLKSYTQAIDYYEQRIAMGIDSAGSRLYRNAAWCALNMAGAAGEEEEDDLDMLEGEEPMMDEPAGNPDVNYYAVAAEWMERFLEFNPDDDAVLLRLGTTYLYNLEDCTNGVKWFERLLELDPDNCDAKRSLGFAYFTGDLCNKNLSRSLNYFHEAYSCITAAGGACGDPALVLWMAKCYHSRAAETANTNKEQSKSDFKNANEWYKKMLKCEPGNAEAKKGVEQTEYEF